MPQLSDPVDWKQTFFLNLIIQLPCTLTVTVCKRIATASGSTTTSTTTSASTKTREGGGKTRMIAQRRVAKKVYAAPYKSRMDVKDAVMQEQSYPLVFYTVNDFESHDLHLPIWDREFLCVELSIIAPKDPAAWPSAASADGDDAAAQHHYHRDVHDYERDESVQIPVDSDRTPFPVPPGCFKVVLFQGAVPYASLLDVYQQKGLATQNQQRRRSRILSTERTEYIMMRGPHGKGQCQVAIQENTDPLPQSHQQHQHLSHSSTIPAASAAPSHPATLTSYASSPAVAGGASPQLPSSSVGDPLARKPESLRCSMTYVNVPWQSIVSDLFEYAKKKRRTAANVWASPAGADAP
ncbi:hypothetical protein DFJ73DRAFT_622177 [Zopfochytrium polystomum]|nr:hypothetical protein DFJ73DRAFT_622177 [Zopfochytrium polystomum]